MAFDVGRSLIRACDEHNAVEVFGYRIGRRYRLNGEVAPNITVQGHLVGAEDQLSLLPARAAAERPWRAFTERAPSLDLELTAPRLTDRPESSAPGVVSGAAEPSAAAGVTAARGLAATATAAASAESLPAGTADETTSAGPDAPVPCSAADRVTATAAGAESESPAVSASTAGAATAGAGAAFAAATAAAGAAVCSPSWLVTYETTPGRPVAEPL